MQFGNDGETEKAMKECPTVSLAQLKAFQAEVVHHALTRTHRAGDAAVQAGDLHIAGVGAAGLLMRLRAGKFCRSRSFRQTAEQKTLQGLQQSRSPSLSLSDGVASANRHARSAAWAVLRRPESHVMMRRETAQPLTSPSVIHTGGIPLALSHESYKCFGSLVAGRRPTNNGQVENDQACTSPLHNRITPCLHLNTSLKV